MANQVLGGGFNSRLNLRLRAKEGLTYGAGSSLDGARLAGLLNVTSFTRTEETGKAINVMLEVVNDFRKNPATPAELSEATSFVSGVFAIQSETAGARGWTGLDVRTQWIAGRLLADLSRAGAQSQRCGRVACRRAARDSGSVVDRRGRQRERLRQIAGAARQRDHRAARKARREPGRSGGKDSLNG